MKMKPKKSKQTEIGESTRRIERIKTFKELIIYLYETFPNGELREDKIKEIIVAGHIRDSLLKSNFLIREPLITEDKKEYFYSLGPNSLALVSSWKNEGLTKKIKKLTCWVIGLTIFNVLLVLVQTLNMWGVFG